MVKDVLLSLRMFRQHPAFTLASVSALTLGLGATIAVFSIVNAVLLRPANLPDPDQLVVFMNTSPQGSGPAASPAKFAHWRRQQDVVMHASAFTGGVVNLTGGEFPEQVPSLRVSADFFTLFGAPIVVGRAFTAEEDLPNGPRVVVIGKTFWERRFNADRGVIGRTLSLGGDPFTIVGVLGDFSFEEFDARADLYVPFQLDPNSGDQGHYFMAAARLRPGVTLEQGRAKLDASAAAFREAFPTALSQGNSFGLERAKDLVVRNVRTSLLVLIGAVSFVLLIACANVANLLLARATGRTREIAIRAAIGGSRARIVRQMLTESVMLSAAGGVLGLLLGIAGMRALLAINTAGLPRVGEAGAHVGVDWRVVTFGLVLSIVTGVVFGLIPALQGSRADLTTNLKEGAGRSGTGFRQNRGRASLVVSEVALALVLLIGSALLIRTAVALTRVDPGFDPTNVLTMRMSLNGPAYVTSAAVAQVIHNGTERLRAIPGVEDASSSCCVPLQGGFGLGFVIAGRPLEGPAHGGAGWVPVSPRYFEVYRIALKRGRTFTEQDNGAGQPVVVINEAMARQYWPDGDPLKDRLIIGHGMREFSADPDRQIVGVVSDTRDDGLNQDPAPRMYVPQAQVPDPANALNMRIGPIAWIVRLRQVSPSLTTQVQDELRKLTGLPISDVETMDRIVSASISRQRFNMWLMSIFGGAALLLAAIGIYGLMAYSVAQRRQELGIRLALGAQASEVRNMVIRQGMLLAAIGLAIGLAGALALSRFITSFLFEVSQWDPVAFVAVPVVLALVALLAVWIPAIRASRVDPIRALRYE